MEINGFKIGDEVKVVKDDIHNFIREGAEGTIIGFLTSEVAAEIQYKVYGDGKGNQIPVGLNDQYNNTYFTPIHRLALKKITKWRDEIGN